MKVCTACNASYSDETLSFCPVDGTTLTPQKDVSFEQIPFSYEPGNWSDAEATASSREDSFTNPEPPITASFSEPSPSASAPQNVSSAAGKPSSNNSIVAVVVCLVAFSLLAGALMIITSGNRGSRDEPQVRATNVAAVRAEPVNAARANSANAVVANSNASANWASVRANSSNAAANGVVTGKPISPKTDLTGIWQGKFSDEPTVLSITTQTSDSFSGTLSKKGYIIKITGKVDFDKGAVAITETKVLQTPPNLNWYLGTNDGTISVDGKSMSGTGRDKNGSYSWSFTKD